jgi:hypothetical protein
MFCKVKRWFAAVALLFVLSYGSLFAQKQPEFAPDAELPLVAGQTADAIGLTPILNRLREVSEQPHSDRWELLALHQQAVTQITLVSLQVDAAAGQVDSEIAEVRELENYMSSRRDSRIDKLNLMALLIGGSAGTASSALGYTSHDNAAATLGVIGGAAATTLSLIALHIAKGEPRELMVPSNMLSEVFNHPSDINNVYPPTVVSFMSSIAPNDLDGLTRQDRLIQSWMEVGRIPDPKTLQGQKKIDRLTSLPGQKVKQTISDLEDRQAMLYDLRVRLSFMKQNLAILLNSLPPLLSPKKDADAATGAKTPFAVRGPGPE